MTFANHLTQPGEGTPERNRFLERMNEKHPKGWSVGGLTLARPCTDEEVFAELNRIQDLDDAGMLERHDSFPEPKEQRNIDDWLAEIDQRAGA